MYMIFKDCDDWFADEMASIYLTKADVEERDLADNHIIDHGFVAFADDPLVFADKLGIPHDKMNVSESTELATSALADDDEEDDDEEDDDDGPRYGMIF